MKKALMVLILILFLLVTVGNAFCEEMAKEGSYTGKNYATGTSKALPMGEERIYVTYEGSGIYVSDLEEGFLNNASMHFLGALHAVKGAFEESGFMVLTVPDGDKVFATWKGLPLYCNYFKNYAYPKLQISQTKSGIIKCH